MYDLDLGIAYVFLVDFVLGVYFAKHKLHHLKENWLDLLGSIPLSDGVFRAMRILRFVRLVRILRAAHAGLDVQDSIEMIRKNQKLKSR
jgi:type II secretory pathway component PulF